MHTTHEVVEENAADAAGHAPVRDLEVSVAPGLELGVVGGVVLVAGDLLGHVEVLAVGFVEVVPASKQNHPVVKFAFNWRLRKA